MLLFPRTCHLHCLSLPRTFSSSSPHAHRMQLQLYTPGQKVPYICNFGLLQFSAVARVARYNVIARYNAKVEPRLPATIEIELDPITGELVSLATRPPLIHGDLLLVLHNVRLLVDVTVARPTTLTLLRGSASIGADRPRMELISIH